MVSGFSAGVIDSSRPPDLREESIIFWSSISTVTKKTFPWAFCSVTALPILASSLQYNPCWDGFHLGKPSSKLPTSPCFYQSLPNPFEEHTRVKDPVCNFLRCQDSKINTRFFETPFLNTHQIRERSALNYEVITTVKSLGSRSQIIKKAKIVFVKRKEKKERNKPSLFNKQILITVNQQNFTQKLYFLNRPTSDVFFTRSLEGKYNCSK